MKPVGVISVASTRRFGINIVLSSSVPRLVDATFVEVPTQGPNSRSGFPSQVDDGR